MPRRAQARIHAVGYRETADVLARADTDSVSPRGVEARDWACIFAQHRSRSLVDREAAEGTVSVRSHDGGNEGAIGVDEFVARIAEEIEAKRLPAGF